MNHLTNRHRGSEDVNRSAHHEPPQFTTTDFDNTSAEVTPVSLAATAAPISRYKLMSPAKLPISRSTSQSLQSPSSSSLLDSPVQFCNIKVEPSPTTGSLHKPHSMLGGVGYATSASTSYLNNSTCVGKIAENPDIGNLSHSLLPTQAYPVTESQRLDLQSQHIEGETVIRSTNSSPPDQSEMRLGTISDNASTDGYNWRKYGQKHVKGCEFPRSYYKCTHPNCEVKKLLEKTHDGRVTEVIYKGTHAHPKPQSKRRFSNENAMGTTDEHLERCHYLNEEMTVGANSQAATPELDGTSEHPSGPPSEDELNDDKYDDGDDPNGKRRKQDMGVVHFISSVKPIREPRVVVQTVSEVDILDDGYRWRKYGQKVVKGNPNPRSYYKCTHLGCPVRKHVERACHDIKSVITTYEGKHNHEVPVAKANNQEAATIDPYSSYTNNMHSSLKENDLASHVSNRYQLQSDHSNQYLIRDNNGENFRFATPYLPSNAYPQNLGSLLMGP